MTNEEAELNERLDRLDGAVTLLKAEVAALREAVDRLKFVVEQAQAKIISVAKEGANA